MDQVDNNKKKNNEPTYTEILEEVISYPKCRIIC